MKVMNCPLNGKRNISEFAHGGELKSMPNSVLCSDQEWADYIFYVDNLVGVITEWWLHVPSGYWFLAERHTGTDTILRTYDPGEMFSQKLMMVNSNVEAKP